MKGSFLEKPLSDKTRTPRFVGELLPRDPSTLVTTTTTSLRPSVGTVFSGSRAAGLAVATCGPSSLEAETLEVLVVLAGLWAESEFLALASRQEPERSALHVLVRSIPTEALPAAKEALENVLHDAHVATSPPPATAQALYESKPRKQLYLPSKR